MISGRCLGPKLSWEILIIIFYLVKGSRIDLFSARSDIYLVTLDLLVFIEGVIFHKCCNNIKSTFLYVHFSNNNFKLIYSDINQNIKVSNLIYLITKISNQLLFENAGGCYDETYIRWKFWISSFRKILFESETFGDLAVMIFSF